MPLRDSFQTGITVAAVLITVLIFAGCRKEFPYFRGNGLRPIYLSHDSLAVVYNTAPRPITNTGPIYLKDTLLFLTEKLQGIHVFNVMDSTNPVPLTFIRIPAVTDFTISGSFMYADSGPHLVKINISDIYQVQVVDVKKNVFMPVLFPSNYFGIFECVDPDKGFVIGWDTAYIIVRCTISQ
ncbi:MAG: hypothetical protein NZM35_05040 [Chitinophagales bacterium]|nr:hypothetical protein [Chitinophagales bacterium]MDW8418588.1 hypothetical protein [Chitinophagales bacterium]